MSTTEFVGWPKTPRLYRDCVITEKIDGTNAAVVIQPYDYSYDVPSSATVVTVDRAYYLFYAQSRKRVITPDADNHGFARWAWDNAQTIAEDLGPGRHFGEWWGQGIQRCYGLDHKRLSLFNTAKWEGNAFATPQLGCVPVLFADEVFDTTLVNYALQFLTTGGSHAAPGFMNPEGICVYHAAASQVFKVLIENDDQPKSA